MNRLAPWTLGALLGVLLVGLPAMSGCSGTHSAVRVQGEGAAALVGVWEGTYRSEGTGRNGSIYFELQAEADSAVGEVVMTYLAEEPTRVEAGTDQREPRRVEPQPGADVLTIRLVHVAGGRVAGRLDPYPDPTCGCLLYTTFEGRLLGDVIEGTFRARGPEHDHVQRGTWRVERQGTSI